METTIKIDDNTIGIIVPQKVIPKTLDSLLNEQERLEKIITDKQTSIANSQAEVDKLNVELDKVNVLIADSETKGIKTQAELSTVNNS